MPSCIVFDVDGTLLDSVDFHARAWEETFRHFGKEVPFADVRRQIGKGGDQLLPVFWSPEELDRLGDAMQDYRGNLFREQYLPRVQAFPQVRELFARVRADGKRIALATSSKKDELKAYLKIADIADLIDAQTSADNVDRSKPHPDIFEAALAALGDVKPQDALAVGDTPYDAQAAGKLGLRTVGLLCGGFPEDDLRAAGCMALYRDPADLLARYEQSPLAGS
ncbi:MAG: HAD family hydrolase [Planctomycetia bacterium]|nr:HAD family hydrolase [Planctomycetia bacterium]